ncbi:MAG: dihydrodipicolinate synthase family protein [Calditrichaeota bacterium]|nr:MAG: dihydrodipicolinate synthase family protein [Calditrichota bacterium]
MASNLPFPQQSIMAALRNGGVIPAHPLALDASRKLDEKRQRALTRYYCAAGAAGLAVAVHTTQFEIHAPASGLLRPVLALASETMDEMATASGKTLIKIAGIVGNTRQAVAEAELAVDLGYHLGLVSLAAWKEASHAELITHLRAVSEIIPIMGFYLQPSVGGRKLDLEFWRSALEIENLLAIKIAPFNRYATLDVLRAVAESGRSQDVALYTGNDDNIVLDLLSTFRFHAQEGTLPLQIVGGLLGQWAVWTQRAVRLFRQIQRIKRHELGFSVGLLQLAHQLTDANAAIFDAKNQFAGCIPGIHEILRRQGLLQGRWTLNPEEDLSPGQMEEIDRVCAAYPHLNDDEFVREHLDEWLR